MTNNEVDKALNTHSAGYSFGIAEGSSRPIDYNFRDMANFNGIFLGSSGSGKTYTLQKALKNMPSNDGVTVHILDKKDDFSYQGFKNNGLAFDMSEDDIEEIDFSYVTGNVGLNLFQFSKLPEAGGVYMAIQEIIAICSLFNSAISQKMGAYLQFVLKKVYADNGIVHDDQNSWSNPSPTLGDVKHELDRVYFNLTTKSQSMESGFWNDLAILTQHYPEEASKNLNVEAHKHVVGMLENSEVDTSHCYAKDWSAPTVCALRDTISGMMESQLFSRPIMRRKSGKINRYRLIGLGPAHLKIVTRVILNQTFTMAARATYANSSHNPPVPSHLVVVDEAKDLVNLGPEELNPSNRINTEGRGFGMGLWLGVQSSGQLSKDMIKNSSLKAILSVEEGSYNEIKRDFGIPSERLKLLVPRVNRLVNMGGGYKLAFG